MTDQEIRSAAASLMGQSRSVKKIAASKGNIQVAQAALRKDISEVECTCNYTTEPDPLLHHSRCRKRWTLYQRSHRAKLKSESETEK